MKCKHTAAVAALLIASASASVAHAQIHVGVVVSETGPAASLGIPEKNAVALLPKEIDGQSISYTVYDDATDTTQAVKAARKLVSEQRVDLLIGASTTPVALALLDVAGETGTPFIALSAAAQIVSPVTGARRWAFKTPQNDVLMADAVARHMQSKGIKTVAFIGFADSYGESWYKAMSEAVVGKGIRLTTHETYARNDTSVLGQAVRMMATHPDAVLMAGGGTPGALPETQLKTLHFGGVMYQTHSVTNNDFLRVCGAACDGTFLPASPMLVAAQLPDGNPLKPGAVAYVKAYEAKYSTDSSPAFGAFMWDASLLAMPSFKAALAKAKPGTPEFRAAVRDALEQQKNVVGVNGVYNMSPTDHAGLDLRARVMVRIEKNKWVYEGS